MRKLRRVTLSEDKDLFNFADVSDLPPEIAKKLHTETADKASAWADIVHRAAAAGIDELTIGQIEGVAYRLKMNVPKSSTVRNYLNKAVALGMLSKPSRQSYGIGVHKPGPQFEDVGLDEEDAVITSPVVVVEDTAPAASDPLADLGL